MFTLETIWNKENIYNSIKDSFNLIATAYKVPLMDDTEAIGIETIIYNYCHALRNQYVKYDDKQEALKDVINIITHNLIPLVVDLRMMMESIDYKNTGKQHQKEAVRPYDNDEPENVNNFWSDTVNYSDVNSMVLNSGLIASNTKYLDKIYKELATICVMIYEG